MDEATGSKAIPLRRSRAAARTASVRPPGWSAGLGAGMRAALGPPRQLWLAALGTAALALRGSVAAWSLAVSEGAEVEAWLRQALGGERDSTAPKAETAG
jgi:hypothetical protein